MNDQPAQSSEFPPADIARIRQAIKSPSGAFDKAVKALYVYTRGYLADTEQWPFGSKIEALRKSVSDADPKAFDAAYTDKIVNYLAWEDHRTKSEANEKVSGNWAAWGLIGGLGTLAAGMALYFTDTLAQFETVLYGLCGIWLFFMVVIYLKQVRR